MSIIDRFQAHLGPVVMARRCCDWQTPINLLRGRLAVLALLSHILRIYRDAAARPPFRALLVRAPLQKALLVSHARTVGIMNASARPRINVSYSAA